MKLMKTLDSKVPDRHYTTEGPLLVNLVEYEGGFNVCLDVDGMRAYYLFPNPVNEQEAREVYKTFDDAPRINELAISARRWPLI